MKAPHEVKAVTVERLDGWLVPKDRTGAVVCEFWLKDIRGYSFQKRQTPTKPLELQVKFVPSPKPPESLGERVSD